MKELKPRFRVFLTMYLKEDENQTFQSFKFIYGTSEQSVVDYLISSYHYEPTTFYVEGAPGTDSGYFLEKDRNPLREAYEKMLQNDYKSPAMGEDRRLYLANVFSYRNYDSRLLAVCDTLGEAELALDQYYERRQNPYLEKLGFIHPEDDSPDFPEMWTRAEDRIGDYEEGNITKIRVGIKAARQKMEEMYKEE